MTTVIYATVVAETEDVEAGGFLLRPQRIPRRSPSMSNPFAHASAARSADIRSLKFTKAHLRRKEDNQLELQQEDATQPTLTLPHGLSTVRTRGRRQVMT
jgi:hypothetical protein